MQQPWLWCYAVDVDDFSVVLSADIAVAAVIETVVSCADDSAAVPVDSGLLLQSSAPQPAPAQVDVASFES